MAQYLYQEYIPSLVKTSGTQVKLPSGAVLNIGGQQYKTASDLLLNLTLSASTTYMVYAVVSGGAVTLVQSTNANSVGPAGYSIWKLVGAVRSDGSSQVLSTGPLSTLRTITTLTSGSGTYTTPVGCVLLRVRMVGGGGGGAGGGTGSLGTGGTGGTTTFGTTLLTATGAGGGSDVNGGASGTASISSPAFGLAIEGGSGCAAQVTGPSQSGYVVGAVGGNSSFGGGGGGGVNSSGYRAAINSGAGGGGGGCTLLNNARGGGSGGAGGYVDATITSPLSSYAYSVGTGGTAGAAGTSGFTGGAGGSGVIIIEESYA